MNFAGEENITKQVGKCQKGASGIIKICDIFSFAENLDSTSFLGGQNL